MHFIFCHAVPPNTKNPSSTKSESRIFLPFHFALFKFKSILIFILSLFICLKWFRIKYAYIFPPVNLAKSPGKQINVGILHVFSFSLFLNLSLLSVCNHFNLSPIFSFSQTLRLNLVQWKRNIFFKYFAVVGFLQILFTYFKAIRS